MSLEINFSKSINPGDNFYLFVNENWINNKENQVPDDHQKWSEFNILREKNVKKIENLLDNLKVLDNQEEKTLKILYTQGLNQKEIDRVKPFDYISSFIDIINKCSNKNKLLEMYAEFNIKYEFNTPIQFSVNPDYKDSKTNILHIHSGGLGLPDRDYYFEKDKENIVSEYKKFIEKYMELFNLKLDVESIYIFEKEIASETYTNIKKRNPDIKNNPVSYEDLSKYNSIPIQILFKYLGIAPGKINVLNKEFINNYEKLWNSKTLELLKDYLKWILIRSISPYLNDNVQKTKFDFYGKILTGANKMQERKKRIISNCDDKLGEIVSKLYVKKYFTESSKNMAKRIVRYIIEEVEDRLLKNTWMQKQTIEKGIEKLRKMNVKIGYPDVYQDYSSLKLSFENSYFENNLLCISFNQNLEWNRLYKKKDKNLWFMNAHTVNAYYSANYNEIVFPAGILQKPFFSEDYDAAINFGAIGSVIGHEITHGFDDSGRKFDLDGNINNWWSETDSKEYNERIKKLIDQYSNYNIVGKKINGELTLGENIADLGGVSISFNALKKYLSKNPNENVTLQELTPYQRFFISFARLWRSNIREEEADRRLTTDVHSPSEFRVNGVLTNLVDFYNAFKLKETDKLWKPEDKRVNIW